MHVDGKYRRKQFSSCDACRSSRVACDALRRSAWGVATCSRCANRNRRCSFEWLKKASVSSESSVASDHLSQLPSPPAGCSEQGVDLSLNSKLSGPPPSSFFERADSHVDNASPGAAVPLTPPATLTTGVANWLQAMYEGVFEEVFGSWLGNYSCPFVFGEHGYLENPPREQSNLSLSVSISTLCRQFDHLMKDMEAQRKTGANRECPALPEMEKERQIEQTLRQAIQTFSARWLPLTFESPTMKAEQIQLIQSLWRDLRKRLPLAMNRPCYRSMLSLYLFAMVPVPIGIQEEEEENGIPAQVCVQAALQQVQYLRARQRRLEFNGSKVSLLPDQMAVISTPEQMRSDFMSMESQIYWAALTFDTSSALTFNTKSLLSSGLLGWELEASWRMVKTCTDIFHEQSENWRLHEASITEESANRIIAAATAWKLRVWKVGTILKEALREGHEEDTVHHAYTCAVEAIDQFNLTYRPLLEACERRLQYLSQYTKLRWYELIAHHNLSILITIDAIEIARRTDILERMSVTRIEAEGSLMNALKFGLSNYFTIPKRGTDTTPDHPRTFPLVAIDPYPHHVVAGVQLLWKGIDREHEAGKMDQSTCENLQSILLQTLELLPQTSKSVKKATEQARFTLIDRSRPVSEYWNIIRQ